MPIKINPANIAIAPSPVTNKACNAFQREDFSSWLKPISR